MRIFVAPAAQPAKTNITRNSSIKAIRELKRQKSVLGSTFGNQPVLVAPADLEVFDRLIDYAYNLPNEVFDYSMGTAFADGCDANGTN